MTELITPRAFRGYPPSLAHGPFPISKHVLPSSPSIITSPSQLSSYKVTVVTLGPQMIQYNLPSLDP
jgi:hypothetical protein